MTASARFGLFGPGVWFLLAGAALCTAVLTVLSLPATWASPGLMAAALTADLALGLPALGWLFLVRGRRDRAWVLAPLALLGFGLSRWFLPTGLREGMPSTELLVVGVELGLLGYLALRVRKVTARYRAHRAETGPGPGAALRALEDVLGTRLGSVLFTEAAVLWYATAGWRRGGSQRPGHITLAGHRRNGYPAVLGAILMAVVAETAALHFLLGLWTPVAAWISTALGLYSGLWLVGDFNAARRNPTRATDEALLLQVGLRWSARLPWDRIEEVRPGGATPDGGTKLVLWGAPDLWLHLRDPLEIRGPYGIRRRTRVIGIGADDPAALRRVLEERVPGESGPRP